jgi:hypothetical protein
VSQPAARVELQQVAAWLLLLLLQQAAEKSAPAQSEAPASSGAVNGINAINQGIRQTFNRMSRPLSRPAANTN